MILASLFDLGHIAQPLGQDFFSLYKSLRQYPEMEFCLTGEQEDQFHDFFTQVQEKYLTLLGMDYMATVRRLGLIAFRISMIFTALRMMETGDFSQTQVCSDCDFQAALSMVRVLVRHSSHVFSEMPEELKLTTRKNKKEQFLDQLPARFSRLEFIEVAKSMGISQRTAESYITTFCDKGLISREQKGVYINPAISNE